MQQALSRLCEAAKLEWFFSRGQTAFERSSCGATLARAELYSIARQYRVPDRLVYDDDGEVIGSECGITARPTAELQSAPATEPNPRAMQDYAVISARMKRIDRADGQVLELLYGDLGQRWIANAHHTGIGRIGALYHLTAKGKRLLDDARKVKGALPRPDTERMETFAKANKLRPTPELTQALAYCQAQALQLEARAHAAWVALSPRRGKQAA